MRNLAAIHHPATTLGLIAVALAVKAPFWVEPPGRDQGIFLRFPGAPRCDRAFLDAL